MFGTDCALLDFFRKGFFKLEKRDFGGGGGGGGGGVSGFWLISF